MYANNLKSGAYYTSSYYYQNAVNTHWHETEVQFYRNCYNGNIGTLPQQSVQYTNHHRTEYQFLLNIMESTSEETIPEHLAQCFETIQRVSSEVVNYNDSGNDSGYDAFKRQLNENLKFFRLDGLKASGFFLSGNIVPSSRRRQ